MTSKIQQKLKRLHDSRVRALDAEPRVVEADEAENTVETVVPVDLPPDRFTNLKRARSLEEKTKASHQSKRKPTVQRSPTTAQPAQNAPATSGSNTQQIGLRVKALRQTLSNDNVEPLPMLFEMIALQPDNTFALSRLVQHYRQTNQPAFAEFFAKRLKEHSPF